MPDPQPKFLLLIRAASDDVDGSSAEVRLGFVEEPTPEEIQRSKVGVEGAFRFAFDEPPRRVAAVVLPWVNELDADDDIQFV